MSRHLRIAVLVPAVAAPLTVLAATTPMYGHYFVLGDNRANSNDSRGFGPLARERIEGRLMLKLF